MDTVRPSGSLARGTHKVPIHDVDLVCVFDAEAHPDWGQSGSSAAEALEHTRNVVRRTLGTSGTHFQDVRLCAIRNHSVKCFLDDPDDPDAFTVDVTPALVHPWRGFWVPERENKQWIHSDPQDLIDRVAERHSEWNEFAKLVRVLKRWNSDHGSHLKSLAMEVLALEILTVASRPSALASFFTAASVRVFDPICDPAGLCGEIQPDMDRGAAAAEFRAAAENAAAAVEAAEREEGRSAMCRWRKVFGETYPEPPGGCDGSGAALLPAAAIAAAPKRKVVNAPQG